MRKSFLILSIVLFTLIPVSLSQPVDALPAPTGSHKTGRTSFHWKDAARDELETRSPEDKRELMVHPSGASPKYIPDADAMREWNEENQARIVAIQTFSIENPPILPGNSRFPVALFLPGGGVKALMYHILLEDLASHGWVVAAIDLPYNGRSIRFPDGRVLGNLPLEERGWPRTQNRDDNFRYYQENIVHWGRDISFVIDQLTAMDRGNELFARRLDLDRGVGYSVIPAAARPPAPCACWTIASAAASTSMA